MAPSPYAADERVLCFHHEILYEAKILELRHQDSTDRKSPFEYRVHYKGWKNTWDDWVLEDRLRKLTDENRELADNIRREAETSQRYKNAKSASKKRAMSDRSSVRDSEERGNSVPGRANKRVRENDIEKLESAAEDVDPWGDSSSVSTLSSVDEDFLASYERFLETLNESDSNADDQEEHFHARPTVRLVIPDNLKSLIVDDWERVTKNAGVVKLPAEYSVRDILDHYREEEVPKRHRFDLLVLDEIIAGMIEYFEVALDRLLLYRYERHQYRVLRKKYSGTKGKSPSGIYGAEHLIRLFSIMGELTAQTNMEYKSTGRTHEEVSKFAIWLSHKSEKYFRTEYVPANDITVDDV